MITRLNKLGESEAAKRIFLIIGSIVFAVAFFEFLALIRVLDYRTFGNAPTDLFAATNVYDAELIHRHPAHSHFSGSARAGVMTYLYQIPESEKVLYQWDLKYDHNGFRNDTDLTHADIAVIGDSFVENMTTPLERSFTSVLQRMQGKAVANLGQYGYCPPQELIVLKRYGLPLQPRTVVWVFYEGNDLAETISYRHPTTLWSFIVQRSFSRAVYREFQRLTAPQKPPAIRRLGWVRTPDGKKEATYFRYPSEPLSNDDLSALADTGQTISAAKKLCAAHQIRLLVVFAPTKFRVYHDSTELPAESECRKWVINDMPERLRKEIGPLSSQVSYLDLTPYLAAAVKDGVPAYYRDDDHWSPEGQAAGASAVSSYLRTIDSVPGVMVSASGQQSTQQQ